LGLINGSLQKKVHKFSGGDSEGRFRPDAIKANGQE